MAAKVSVQARGTWLVYLDRLVVKDSQTSVKAAEGEGIENRHDQEARCQRENVPGLAQIEASNLAHKQISYREIEEAPQHIHRRGRQSYPGRSGEWTLEGAT